MADQAAFTISGRTFRPVRTTTLEHDIWLGGVVRRSGLRDAKIPEDAEAEEFQANVYFRLLESGEAFHFLGGLVVPEGTDDLAWTPALANETAAFFRTLTDKDAKQDVQAILVTLVTDFFAPVLASLRALRGVSSRAPQNASAARAA